MKRSSFIFLSILYFLPYVLMASINIFYLFTVISLFLTLFNIESTILYSIADVLAPVTHSDTFMKIGSLLLIVGVFSVFAIYRWLDWPSRIIHLCMTIAAITILLITRESGLLYIELILIVILSVPFYVLHIRNYIKLVKKRKQKLVI